MTCNYLDHTTFNERLAIAIEVSRITQAELSERSGIGQTQISHYVIGTRKPSLDNLAQMAQHLRVDIGWLIGLAPEKRP